MGYSPQRALWLPPLIEHSYRLLSHTELRAVYLSGSLISECTHFSENNRVHVIEVVPLVKELIAGLFINDYHTITKRKWRFYFWKSSVKRPPYPQSYRCRRMTDYYVQQGS
nr:Uncharacterised protein [Klebsiella pneumoniae]